MAAVRMTIATQRVLRALLEDVNAERCGLEIADLAGLATGTVHPILARLEGAGWLESRWEEVEPRTEGRAARRYYRLTASGVERARHALARAYRSPARRVFSPSPRPGESSAQPEWLVGQTGRARDGSTPGQGPTAGARSGVALASRALSAGPVRERWREEFSADLQVLNRRRQATYTVGVLANAWALRSALRKGEPAILETTWTTRLTCRLNLRHRWRVVSTEDGNPHWECTACHKLWVTVRPPGDWSPGF